jgi:hypothetical protein
MPDATSAAPSQRDAAAKRGLTVAILLGVVLGAWLGAPRYGLFHLSTVAVMGLTVIATVFTYTVAVAVGALRRSKRA